MSRFEGLVFFGKGGIGKSTIASNVSALLGASGRKVLHIGCDPKLDSTLALAGRHIPPFSGSSGPDAEARLRGFIQPAAVRGVHCVEAGGPQAGVGCAGAGISALLEAVKGSRLLERDGYGAAVFDVLGDVVCGGFAAPLRRGFARKVIIVTSEEPLSLYAANRLILMTENFARNGVYLAGLAINCRGAAGAGLAGKFAAAVNARVLAVLPRDPAVEKAERLRTPAALAFPKSPFALAALRLTSAALAAGRPKTPPRALSDAEFGAFIAGRARLKPSPAPSRRAAARPSAAEAFRAAGLEPERLEGGQIVCAWRVPGGIRRIVLAPAGPAAAGRLLVSDWAACIHPSSDESAAGGETVKDAVAGLAPYRFEELLAYFGGGETFHAAAGALGASGNFSDSAAKGKAPRRPHLGAGQEARFVFPAGSVPLALPPDLAVAEHGDAECRFCETSPGQLGFFCGGASEPPALPKGGDNIFSTGFGQADALRGQEGLVRRALEAAARSAGPGGLVEFYATCGPMLLAGDTAAAALAAETEFGVKVLRENYNSYEEYSAAKAAARADLVYAGLKRHKARARGRRPDLAFFNYPQLNDSLAAALGAAGLRLAPRGGFYETLAAARLLVLPAYDAAICPALDRAGIRWLVPPAPYGRRAARAWFAAIFRALGLRRSPPAPSPAQAREHAVLARQAGRFSAGLVAEAAELGQLAGAPWLPLLAEAGFGLRLLVRAPDLAGRLPAAAPAARLKKLFGPARFSAAFFSDDGALGGLLARPASMRLVYSDIRRDPRVLAAGKNPFGPALFEPGYDGALESARRLLRLCAWEFSGRYLAVEP